MLFYKNLRLHVNSGTIDAIIDPGVDFLIFGQEVILNPGFEVKSGGTLEILMDRDCN